MGLQTRVEEETVAVFLAFLVFKEGLRQFYQLGFALILREFVRFALRGGSLLVRNMPGFTANF